MYEYGHYCVPVTKMPKNASYVPMLGCFVTDCDKHPMNFEFLFIPEDNSVLPAELRTRHHLAFNVDNFDEMLATNRVLFQFVCPKDETSRVAFLEYQGAIIEIKEVTFK